MTKETIAEFISSTLEESGFVRQVSPACYYDGLGYSYDDTNHRFTLTYKKVYTVLDPVDYLYIGTLLQNIEWYQNDFIRDNK